MFVDACGLTGGSCGLDAVQSHGSVLWLLLLLRALFDYDPSRDAGLPGRGLDFRFGHILNVVGDDDADWWHAVRVVPDDGRSGVVPSKRR